MARLTTLPSHWDRLAEILVGVAQLADTLGTVPRTVNQWAKHERIPRGPTRKLIVHVFRANGIEPPEPNFVMCSNDSD